MTPEELRGRVAYLESVRDDMRNKIAALEAERDRLRAALEEIAAHGVECCPWVNSFAVRALADKAGKEG